MMEFLPRLKGFVLIIGEEKFIACRNRILSENVGNV